VNTDLKNHRLRESLQNLARYGVVPGAGAILDKDRKSVQRELHESTIADIPAFSASGNPDILPQLAAHAGEHVEEILRLFNSSDVGDFGFVREHARLRAEQKFPLEATLHAYRCGHKVISRWTRDAALASADQTMQVRSVVAAVADFAIEYTDQISTIATAEYVARTREIAVAEGDLRTELFRVLLSGYDEADGRVARLLRRSGYLEQRQSYCVVVVRPVIATEMKSPARAQRLMESLKTAVSGMPIRSLVGVGDNTVTAVLSATRRISGWTPQRKELATRVKQHLLQLGNAVLVGISSDAPSTSHIPNAREEATVALDFADVSNRVVQYAEIPVRKMILRLVQDSMQSALPAWLDDFIAADGQAKGSLKKTLEAYADANMNVLRAAEILSVHPNTIYSRLQKIEDKTGKNALAYHDLNELLLASDCKRV
jgi:hypothetical protein